MRRMQVSEIPLYVFVEGFEDRYFYSRIVGSECRPGELEYKVITGEELHDGEGGGKGVLMRFFDYLEERKALAGTFQSKRTVALFFVDKDIDDMLGMLRIEEQLIYTESYDVESYLFNHGELSRAAAGAAGLDIDSVQTYLGDYADWRSRATESWRSWVKVCVFAQMYAPSSGRFYGRPQSELNDELYGPVNTEKYSECLVRLRQPSMSKAEFEKRFCKIGKQVDLLYSKGLCDRVFKGKWYLQFLAQDVKDLARERRFNKRYLTHGLRIALEQTLDWEEPWALDLRMPVRRIIDRLKSCVFGS